MNLNFKKMDGLLPAVVQDAVSGEILMLAFMNEAAWQATLQSGFATFWSRTRQALWLKGETSGDKLLVKEILADCDLDSLILKVEPQGKAVCHEGTPTCFTRKFVAGEWVR